MIPYFPKQIATKGIYLYLGALAAISLVFLQHAMSIDFLIMGVMWVVGFFLLSNYCSKKWQATPQKRFLINLFLIALGLRWAWSIFAYIYYLLKTGMPFEFSAGDSIWYYEETLGNVHANIGDVWRYLFVDTDAISDSG